MRSDPIDVEWFTAAFARHGRALWVIAAAWVGRTEAADLVQEVARVGWQKRHQFAAGGDERAWLAQITRHLGANWRRRRRPALIDEHVLRAVPAAPVPAPVWPFDVDHSGLSAELSGALSNLAELPRACLLLQVVLGYSFAEIATMLAIPENTAASHARRARLALRTALAPTAPSPAVARGKS